VKQRVQIPLRHFFATPPGPCPYLPDRIERKVVTLLLGDEPERLHEALSHAGFRRSQDLAYRPACEVCSACVSVRVPAAAFQPNRGQRRVLARNRDIGERWLSAIATHEHYVLFRRYILARHRGGGMADMDFADYRAMVEDSPVRTALVEFRGANEELLGVSLTDRMGDGFSLVYSFFEPDAEARGLGTLMILRHLASAAAQGLGYVYLGYWVAGSPKMAYKANFKPAEVLRAEGWRRLDGSGPGATGTQGTPAIPAFPVLRDKSRFV
jgi:leucyl-tRNA---protein transferase